MKTVRTILIILTFMTFVCARGQNKLGQIPKQVKQTADSLINLTLGTDYSTKTTYNCETSLIYLNDHLFLNACRTTKTKKKIKKKDKTDIRPEFFVLKYQLALTENSNYNFEVRIDRNLKLKENISLPDCANTNACRITVDSLSAIDLAIKSGLTKGLGIYNDGLMFDSLTNSFQWKIKNHISEKPDKGDMIYIDALTGQRIVDKDRQWLRSIVH